jgi:hypothetical protein
VEAGVVVTEVTPVPPYNIGIVDAFHVPEVSVPTVVMFDCTADGNVEESDGTPPADVINTLLFAVDKPLSVLVDEEYRS